MVSPRFGIFWITVLFIIGAALMSSHLPSLIETRAKVSSNTMPTSDATPTTAPSLFHPSTYVSSAAFRNYELRNVTLDARPPKLSTADLIHAADFKLVVGSGSGQSGFNVLKVSADGKCEFTFLDGRSLHGSVSWYWRRSTFTIDPKIVDLLRSTLVAENILALKRTYSGGVEDGAQEFVKVQASGNRKAIWCDNHFPKEIIELIEFLNENILRPHSRDLANSPEIVLPRAEWESPKF